MRLPRYIFAGPAAASIARLPGAWGDKKRLDRVHVARNLAPLAATGLLGAVTFQGTWAAPVPDTSWSWERVVAALLAGGEVRELYLSDYPLPYQREGISYCAGLYGAHMSWPGGAGKTFASICWACLSPAPGPVIHVTRASTRLQIARQWTRYTHLHPWVVRPVNELRKRDVPWAQGLAQTLAEGKRPVLVAGWESLIEHGETIANILGPALAETSIIFDESHKAKAVKRWARVLADDGSASFKRRKNVSSAASALAGAVARRLCTTATFVPDRPRDGWAQLDLAEPGDWGRFLEYSQDGAIIGGFAVRYCDAKPATWGGADTSGLANAEELLARISTCTHRVSLAETHRDLPPKRRQSIIIPLADQAPAPASFRELYKKARGAQVLEVALMESAARKRNVIVGMVEDAVAAAQKVVIFTGRREEVVSLEAAVRKRLGPDAAVWAAVGGDGAHLDACKTAYMNAPGPAVLIGTGQAWGTGHDLQDTDLALFAMLPWTGGDLHQWEQRFFRHGMKRPVLICYLICEQSRDEAIVAALLEKLPAVELLGGDADTAAAADALRGVEDREAIAASLLDFINNVNTDDVPDEEL